MKDKKRAVAVIPYIVVAGLTVIILCILYGGIDIHRPIVYDGDGVSATYLIKTIKDTGWFLENPWVGGIYGGNWGDYTMCDNLSFFLVKLLSLFSDNCFLMYNMFYFLTYVLVALTAFGVFRVLKVNTVAGTTGALLYSFLAFHQFRAPHIWLTPYFMVPLGLLVAIWIAADSYGIDGLKGRSLFCNKKVIASAVILFLCAFTGFYYAFFTCIIVFMAGVILLLKKASVRRVLFILSGLGIVALGVLTNVFPSLIYWMQNGLNEKSELLTRAITDPEYYSLKMVQLLLPRQGHRLPAFAQIAGDYHTYFFLNNENHTATLGMVAGLGFLILLLLLFKRNLRQKYVEEIKWLNLGIFLTATIGGIGEIFSMFVSTPMRCYNRLSIYIAFLSLLFLALSATDLLVKVRRVHIRRILCAGISLVVLGVGIWDQTTDFGMEAQAAATQSFDSDREFIQKIEEKLPADSMVFELPVVGFPSEGYYDMYKGYMHSNQIIWSYGGMQGREEHCWETNLMNYPVDEFLDHICYAGYQGLYVDSLIYTEKGLDFNLFLQKVGMYLLEQPMISADGRLYFWDLRGYQQQKAAVLGEKEVKRRQALEYNVVTSYESGFSEKVETLEGYSRWSDMISTIEIIYHGEEPCKAYLEGTVYSGYGEKSNLKVSANGNEQTIPFNNAGKEIHIPIELHKGTNVITFTSDAVDIQVEGQPQVRNFKIDSPVLRFEE